MPNLLTGTIVERTPMRDLARRLVFVLFEARIPAWMAARPGLEVTGDGVCAMATAWDVLVSEPQADRARRVIAAARRRLLGSSRTARRAAQFA